jgi:hypothetical protein
MKSDTEVLITLHEASTFCPIGVAVHNFANVLLYTVIYKFQMYSCHYAVSRYLGNELCSVNMLHEHE